MSAIRRVVPVAVLVLTFMPLTGCIQSGVYVMQRSNDGVVTTTLVGCSHAPIDRFSVVRVGEGDSEGELEQIWAVERAAAEPGERETFTIGTPPPGYVEVEPFRPGLLTPDAMVLFDVEPSPSLGIVRLGDVPAGGQPYLIGMGGTPRQLPDLDDYLAEHRDDCSAGGRTRQVFAQAVIVLVACAVGATLAWTRHRRRLSSSQTV